MTRVSIVITVYCALFVFFFATHCAVITFFLKNNFDLAMLNISYLELSASKLEIMRLK